MARSTAALCAAALLGQYAFGAVGGAVAQDATPRTALEYVLSLRLGEEVNRSNACQVVDVILQQQLAAAKKRVEELESDLAEANGLAGKGKP